MVLGSKQISHFGSREVIDFCSCDVDGDDETRRMNLKALRNILAWIGYLIDKFQFLIEFSLLSVDSFVASVILS